MKESANQRIRGVQLVGFLLWRGGLLLAGGYTFFRIARFALQYIDLPLQLEIGLALIIVGCIFVAASFIAERRMDYLAEGELRE